MFEQKCRGHIPGNLVATPVLKMSRCRSNFSHQSYYLENMSSSHWNFCFSGKATTFRAIYTCVFPAVTSCKHIVCPFYFHAINYLMLRAYALCLQHVLFNTATHTGKFSAYDSCLLTFISFSLFLIYLCYPLLFSVLHSQIFVILKYFPLFIFPMFYFPQTPHYILSVVLFSHPTCPFYFPLPLPASN
jgi:hypothetical protein